MKLNERLIVFTLVLVAITTACKFYFGPNLAWSGFSPIIAIALFSGMIIKERNQSFLLPLLALVISDVLIHLLYNMGEFPYAGFYSGQWKNYLILLVSVLIGWRLKGKTYSSLLAGAVVAPTAFFLLSNLGVWMGATEAIYSKDFSGLMTCYAAGLPFFKNAFIATLFFFPVILLCYNYFTRQKAELTLA
jgi:hypothetical protein